MKKNKNKKKLVRALVTLYTYVTGWVVSSKTVGNYSHVCKQFSVNMERSMLRYAGLLCLDISLWLSLAGLSVSKCGQG